MERKVQDPTTGPFLLFLLDEKAKRKYQGQDHRALAPTPVGLSTSQTLTVGRESPCHRVAQATDRREAAAVAAALPVGMLPTVSFQ